MTTAGLILNPETKLAALILAEKTFERYRNISGHYRNTASNHLVGHLGEFAAFIWLRDNGFEPEAYFSDPSRDRECDITTNIGRVEVKTWSEHHWSEWGRAVSVTQLKSIQKKADFLFFCTVAEVESETPHVKFPGWCPVSIIDQREPIWTGYTTRRIHNYQIAESELKSVDEMAKLRL